VSEIDGRDIRGTSEIVAGYLVCVCVCPHPVCW